MTDEQKHRYDPKTKITPEIGEQILKAYLTETPRPSRRDLAKRFGLSLGSIQRYIAKHETAVEQVIQYDGGRATAQLVVAALPEAQARLRGITQDLATEKMGRVLEEAEKQYRALKDDDPQLAGAYLREMRQTVVELGRWIGIEKTIQDATPIMINGKSVEKRCADCPHRERFTREELKRYLKGEETQDVNVR